MSKIDEALTFEALYDSMWKCKRGKMWKTSVARFVQHGIEETLKLEQQLADGTYIPRKPHEFELTYPKRRPCSSTHIRDRIVQRSVNDLVLYPNMANSFIWDNFACQKGKGTTKALDRVDCFLHRYYINNGNSNEGWVYRRDVEHYYNSMDHDISMDCFAKHNDEKTMYLIKRWMARQYPGTVGFAPGSQMIQILGISLLDEFDHFVKERLGVEYYERFMDDSYSISNSREFLEFCHEEETKCISDVKLRLHPRKTRIYPLKEGIEFLGFTFKLTESGEVIRLIKPQNVKHERLKLRRMAAMVKRGEMSKQKFYECYGAWKAHAELGNTAQVIMRMDKFVKSLFEEDNT